ncbi:MAG: tetratricopeptide repeat protein, partial [Owenweeksia sp.]
IYNAMQIDSNSAEARLLKGKLHFVQNRTRQSKLEWERCIQLDPENVPCRLKMAELYIVVMDFTAALELLNEVIKIDNNNAEAYFYKGIVVRDFKLDTSLALQYFQRAIDLKQDYVKALDMMGVMLSTRNDTLAKYYFQRILALEPNRGDIYFKLGVYYMNRKEMNRALESYTKAVQLNPKDAGSYFNMGVIHVDLKAYEQAAGFFTQAINSQEKNYKAYYGRGYCYEVTGQFEKSKEDYLMAIQSNPSYTPAGEGLERVNKALKELNSPPPN